MCGDEPEATDPATVRASTPAWTREQAAALSRSADTVAPVLASPDERIDGDRHLWDTWLLRERDGSIATVGGYRVIFALTAPAGVLPGKRHDEATIRYFHSTDGRSWTPGGPVFDGGALGSRQWAGSALYDGGEVFVFYTAAGRKSAGELTYEQRVAAASGGWVRTGTDLRIEGPWQHDVLFDPDGVQYEHEQQGEGMVYTFRDPWFFEDPAGGTYLLFEANVPIEPDSDACGGDPERQSFNGCVGLAVSPTGDPTDWELRNPLLHATCVNQELERPHLVVRDGRYYLFVNSHEFTFAPGLTGYEGLYGFVADELRGDYRPLNDGGLVVANPASEPHQAYSWLVYQHTEGLLVTSFANYHDLGGRHIDDVGELPEQDQQAMFGGTLAPTLRLAIEGDRTRITGRLGPGHLPQYDEKLPAVDRPLSRRPATGRSFSVHRGNGAHGRSAGRETGDREARTSRYTRT